ncbi:MAG TPA: glycosyltransferase family 1 protein [Candidatus Marinimicrobia bacterium]|jgi:glycosyltransferase involved in cell wall biosynthesis|nr:glycosyltransferase family 1 protein [Candidatus Neomarinimicrobiota bacterium]|tara:strand:+ start:17540 stop:18652 length:1113 start_codon:yes stop_codon:yes gene_type:complete
MRIGIFTHSLADGGLTGQGTYVKELITGLSKKNDIEVILLYFHESEISYFKDLRSRKLPKITIPKSPPMVFSPFFTRKLDLDLLHFPSDGISPFINEKDNVVYTCHGVAPFVLSRKIHKPMNPIITRTLNNKHHAIKKIITPSMSSKKDIAEVFNIEEDKIEAIFHGINEQFFKPVDISENEQFKNNNSLNYPYLLHVSNYQPMKNIEKIISAFSNVSTKLQEHKLVLAGSKGWKYESITNQISELDLQEKIVHFGKMDSKSLKILYSNADMFLFPSLWESFGFPAFEAMACGTPAIISNTYSLAEIAGDSGLKVNPNSVDEISDGIMKIINNENLRNELSRRGLETAEKLTWESAVNKHYELFNKLVNG